MPSAKTVQFRSEYTHFYEREVAAYRRLTERGVPQKRLVPSFYGCIEHIHPKDWPNRHKFEDESPDNPLNAILIEYIPGIEPLTFETATPERMDKFGEGMQAIHDAGVLHLDAYARNMMIDPSKPDKAIWLDFDRARVLGDELSERDKLIMWNEQECTLGFGDFVVSILLRKLDLFRDTDPDTTRLRTARPARLVKA